MRLVNAIKSIFGGLGKKDAIGGDDLASRTGYLYDTYSGEQVSDMRAMQTSAVWGCVRVLCESVGMLPCNLFKLTKDNKKEVAINEKLHKLLSVMPNSYMTPQEFWELLMLCLCLRGNFYAYKVEVFGEVAELLPLDPGSVQPKRTNDWGVEYHVTFPDGHTEILDQSKIWHVRLFTLDGLNGLSPIAAARNGIGFNIATEKHGSSLFKNGATPSGVLKTDAELNDKAFNRLRDEFHDTYEGSENSFRTMILELGLDWKPIMMSNEDAQYLESRRFGLEEICRFFRVPAHLVQNLDKATFNNIEHLGMSFVNYTLTPYLTRIQQRINIGLVKKSRIGKLFALFDAGMLLRGDMKTRFEAYATGINWGILSPNECRHLENMNSREDGDVYLAPLNMTTDPKANQQDNEKTNEGGDNANVSD